MRLQAQAPSRMLQTVLDGELRVAQTIGAVHRLQEEVGEGQALQRFRVDAGSVGRSASARRPQSEDQLRPGLRLTQTQSIPASPGCVPFVSMAIVKPSACSDSMSGASSCGSGSPPVQTTKRDAACARRPGGRRRPSRVPRARRNDRLRAVDPRRNRYRRNRQTAVALIRPRARTRGCSRRIAQNTAGRPALAPSPWSV